MVVRMGAKEARNKFADLLGSVHYGGEVVIVERSGRPMVAVISLEMYERMIADREARFEAVDGIRGRVPEVTAEEVEEDVAEAIAAVRGASAEGGP